MAYNASQSITKEKVKKSDKGPIWFVSMAFIGSIWISPYLEVIIFKT